MERARVIPLRWPAPARIVRIGHGERSTPLVYDRQRGTLALPPGLIRELGMVPGQEVHVVARDGGRRFVIGPLVGLWVSPAAIRDWSPSVRILVEETRAAGAIPLVFDLDGAERREGRIAGWVERDGEPGRAILPLPDVIYNRATYPNLRRRIRARRLRERMMELDRIPFVNTASGFPKWETYETLCFFAETRDLVPDAIRFGSKNSLARFLRRHRLVFLKENTGSGGAPGTSGWRQRRTRTASGRCPSFSSAGDTRSLWSPTRPRAATPFSSPTSWPVSAEPGNWRTWRPRPLASAAS